MKYLVKDNSSDMPKTPEEVIQRFKETNDVLNEFREPTKPVKNTNPITSSSITAYLFFSIIFAVVVISFLYWRYKRSI